MSKQTAQDFLDEIREQVDTIVRDEAYDGGFGALNEEQFNKMAATIASQIMELIVERL